MGMKKKNPVIGYHYELGVQMAVAHAPVDKITQLSFGERTAWTGSVSSGVIPVDQPNLFGGEKREGGVSGTITVYDGNKLQQPDPYVQLFRGDTSAQRGLLSLVFGNQGQSFSHQIRSINFNNSTISAAFEEKLGYEPKGLLTTTANDMTKDQALTYISNFFSGILPYNEPPSKDSSGREKQGTYRQPLEEQKAVYGTYRAVALMYAYRSFVLGNLGNNPKIRATADEFFGNLVRDTVADYRNTNPFRWCAMSPYFKSVWVRVQSIFGMWRDNNVWYPDKAAIRGSNFTADNGASIEILDMNPAHIIYKVLTNPVWGMGYNTHDIDDASFRKAADTLYEEKFGISLAWRRETTIEDFIAMILDTIDAALRINVLSGKYELILIRNNYKLADLPILDEDSIVELNKFERASWADSPNELVLTYKDRNENNAVVTVQNLSAINIQGNVISSTQTYEGVHEPELAARIAARELNAMSTQLAKISITTNRTAFLLQHGDVFNLRWPELGIENLPCRVLNVAKGEFDNGEIVIDAVEDVFGMPQQTYIKKQDTLWDNTNPMIPLPISKYKLHEATYYDVVQELGSAPTGNKDTVTFMKVLAEKPSDAALSFDLFSTNNTSNGFSAAESGMEFTHSATILDALDKIKDRFYITWDGTIQNENDVKTSKTGIYLAVNDELMAIEGLDIRNGFIVVKRGILDTIPQEHPLNSTAWLVMPTAAIDSTERTINERIQYKMLTNTMRGRLPIDNAPSVQTTAVGRQLLPFPPANVRINNQRSLTSIGKKDNLKIDWVYRNRLLAEPTLGWYDNNVASEPEVKYHLTIYNMANNGVVYSNQQIAANTITVNPPSKVEYVTLPSNLETDLIYHYNGTAQTAPNKGLVNKPLQYTRDSYYERTYQGSDVIYLYRISARGYITLPNDENLSSPYLSIGLKFKTEFPNLPLMRVGAPVSGQGYPQTGIAGLELIDGKIVAYLGAYYTPQVLSVSHAIGNGYKSYMNATATFNVWTGTINLFIEGKRVATSTPSNMYKAAKYNASGVKNLFVYNNASNIELLANGSTTNGTTNHPIVSDFVATQAGKQYCLQLFTDRVSSSALMSIAFYDSNKRFISIVRETKALAASGNMNKAVLKATAPANAAFVRFATQYGQVGVGLVMVSEGNTEPAYNMAENDVWGGAVKTGITVGGISHNGTYYATSGTEILHMYCYKRAMPNDAVLAIHAMGGKTEWPDKIRVELKSVRGRYNSYQTFYQDITAA
nr:MAG TPA: tail protein [Caudoviricetes sp.]